MTIVAPQDGDLLDPAWAQEITAAVEALLADITDWTTWAPTYSAITVGTGTVTARYKIIHGTCFWKYRLLMSASSSIGTNPEFSLPATPSADYVAFQQIGRGKIIDASTGAGRQAQAAWNSPRARITYWNATPDLAGITATAPWTWATGDVLELEGWFEVL